MVTETGLSQEWKWRDEPTNLLNHIVLHRTIYKLDTFNKRADFRLTQFDTIASFSKALFNSYADFTESKFDSKADFTEAKFDSNAFFHNTRFASSAAFSYVTFASQADFSSIKFSSYAHFVGAQFGSKVSFVWSKFDSTANFQNVKFDSRVSFINCKFKSKAYFSRTHFDSKADFSLVKFASSIHFIETKFSDSLTFKAAEFNGQVFFIGDTLPKYLDFSQVNIIANEIDFTKSVINPKYGTCNINLTDAAIEKFRFRYKRFKLWFPSNGSIGYELKSNVYEELLKKQKDEGFTQSYEILDKEYREFQYIDSGAERGIWGHLLNWIDKNWWGYGYDKELIIRNIIIIFLAISLINTLILRHLTFRVYLSQDIIELLDTQKEKRWYSKASNYFLYSLFYTAIIFFSFKFDIEKLKVKENLKGWQSINLIYFFTIYLGGLVCLAYLANYIITV